MHATKQLKTSHLEVTMTIVASRCHTHGGTEWHEVALGGNGCLSSSASLAKITSMYISPGFHL